MIFGTSENFTVSQHTGFVGGGGVTQKTLKGGIEKRIAQTEWSHKFVEPIFLSV